MNENSSPQTGENNRGPRSQNRGGRRSGNSSRGPRRDDRGGAPRNNDSSRNSHKERSNYGTRDKAPAKPLTFWQKIVGFFSAKPAAPAPLPAAVPSRHPTEVRAQQRQEGRPSDTYRRLEHRPTSEEAAAMEAESPEPRESRETREARPPREPRVMEKIEVTSPKLYVGNLSFDATESDLSELFNGVGQVRNAEVVSNNYTQRSKGFAFVTMETIDEAKRAVVELHDKEFMGRKLLVSGAKVSDRDAA